MNTQKLLAFVRLYITIFQVLVKHYLNTKRMQIKQMLRPLSSDFCLTIFAPTSAFHAFGHQSSSDFPSDFFEGDPKPTRRNTEQPWEKGRSWSGISRVMLSCLAIVSMFSLSAQTPRKDSGADGLKEIEMLTVGQKVPEAFWTYKYKFYSNGDTLSRTLQHLKGNPIVFDFWASWCSPCISSLKETNSFINKLTEKGNFIAVTFEDAKIAHRTWKQHDLHLPSIIEDKLLKQYFPHASIPQVIWIDAEGIVRNQTSQQPINQKNLNSFFAGRLLDLQAKPVFDKNRPILPHTDADKTALQYYQMVLKGYQDYLPVAKFSRDIPEGYFTTSFVNIPLITIYRDLAPKLFVALGEPFFDENFKVKASDSVGLNRPYTMDLIAPTSDHLSLNTTMVELLNKASGYQAGIQKESRECLVMKRIGQIIVADASKKRHKSIDWDKKIQLQNVPLAYALGVLSDQRLGGKFIVNETGYKGKIDLDIKVTNDLDKLNAQLAKSGMKLENAVRDVNVFVVEKAKGE